MNEKQSVASLIYWKDGVSKEDADQVIKELQASGMIESNDTREYNEAWGSPCWYIP